MMLVLVAVGLGVANHLYKNGFHKRTHPSGDVYEGDWVDGKQHGKGTYTSSDGNVYEGDWVDDKQHGKGTYTWPDGNVYEGDWMDGKHTGKGKRTWPSVAMYEGDVVDSTPIGNVSFTFYRASHFKVASSVVAECTAASEVLRNHTMHVVHEAYKLANWNGLVPQSWIQERVDQLAAERQAHVAQSELAIQEARSELKNAAQLDELEQCTRTEKTTSMMDEGLEALNYLHREQASGRASVTLAATKTALEESEAEALEARASLDREKLQGDDVDIEACAALKGTIEAAVERGAALGTELAELEEEDRKEKEELRQAGDMCQALRELGASFPEWAAAEHARLLKEKAQFVETEDFVSAQERQKAAKSLAVDMNKPDKEGSCIRAVQVWVAGPCRCMLPMLAERYPTLFYMRSHLNLHL